LQKNLEVISFPLENNFLDSKKDIYFLLIVFLSFENVAAEKIVLQYATNVCFSIISETLELNSSIACALTCSNKAPFGFGNKSFL
jgi:hypothetical protein